MPYGFAVRVCGPAGRGGRGPREGAATPGDAATPQAAAASRRDKGGELVEFTPRRRNACAARHAELCVFGVEMLVEDALAIAKAGGRGASRPEQAVAAAPTQAAAASEAAAAETGGEGDATPDAAGCVRWQRRSKDSAYAAAAAGRYHRRVARAGHREGARQNRQPLPRRRQRRRACRTRRRTLRALFEKNQSARR